MRFTVCNANVRGTDMDELKPMPEEHIHHYQYQFSVDRDYQIWDYFQCGCGDCTHNIRYKHTPADCPKHAFEFIGTKFHDGPHGHEILQVFRCDRCGATHEVPRHMDAAGISGMIEIEDPRVKHTLLMNKSVWDRVISYEAKSCSTGKPPEHVTLPDEASV